MPTDSAWGDGLTRAPTDALIGMLRAVHRADIPYPLTRSTLIQMGYGAHESSLTTLVGLDERGLRAVLVAVIAERRKAEPK